MRTARTILALVAALAPAAPAQQFDAVQRFDPTQDVGIDQKLGAQVPLDLVFRDEDGAEVKLSSCFRGRPVVLSLVYFECPMLCTLVLNDQVRALRALPLELGRDYDVLTVSIDPSETAELARDKKRGYVATYDKDAGAEQHAAWRFLTGDEASIRALADSVGFRYAYDAASDEYAHAAGLMVLSPDGVVSRYFYGIEYSSKDLRLSLVEAGEGKVGSLVDQVLMLCFHYDPATGRYGFAIMNALRAAGLLTVALLLGFMLRHIVRERRLERAEGRP
jgi:protein SCO1